MLTVLNLHEDQEEAEKRRTLARRYVAFASHYHQHRKHAHRFRLVLETICSVGYAIETKLFMFGFIAMIWVLVDVTMLIADDAD